MKKCAYCEHYADNICTFVIIDENGVEKVSKTAPLDCVVLREKQEGLRSPYKEKKNE